MWKKIRNKLVMSVLQKEMGSIALEDNYSNYLLDCYNTVIQDLYYRELK